MVHVAQKGASKQSSSLKRRICPPVEVLGVTVEKQVQLVQLKGGSRPPPKSAVGVSGRCC